MHKTIAEFFINAGSSSKQIIETSKIQLNLNSKIRLIDLILSIKYFVKIKSFVFIKLKLKIELNCSI